jgi:hypothetical protein
VIRSSHLPSISLWKTPPRRGFPWNWNEFILVCVQLTGGIMKHFIFLIIPLLMITACTQPPALPGTIEPNKETTKECEITPHDIPSQGIPIPVALVVDRAESESLDLLWRDGTLMGSWEIDNITPITSLHLAGPATDGLENIDLIYLAGDENDNTRFILKRGIQESTLVEVLSPLMVTGFVGIQAKPVFTYSTVVPPDDNGSLKSSITIAGLNGGYFEKLAYQEVRTDSRFIVPIAIHMDESGQPDGIWYTTNLLGVDGDWLTDQRAGLYYFDLENNTNLEFLNTGCRFGSLSTSQARAAWLSETAIHIIDLHTGQDAFYPSKDKSSSGPILASLSPQDSFVAWVEESASSQSSDGIDMLLRIGIPTGSIFREYDRDQLAEIAGFGKDISLMPVGWIFPENENLLVQVKSSNNQSLILSIDVTTGTISKIAAADLRGFGYP